MMLKDIRGRTGFYLDYRVHHSMKRLPAESRLRLLDAMGDFSEYGEIEPDEYFNNDTAMLILYEQFREAETERKKHYEDIAVTNSKNAFKKSNPDATEEEVYQHGEKHRGKMEAERARATAANARERKQARQNRLDRLDGFYNGEEDSLNLYTARDNIPVSNIGQVDPESKENVKKLTISPSATATFPQRPPIAPVSLKDREACFNYLRDRYGINIYKIDPDNHKGQKARDGVAEALKLPPGERMARLDLLAGMFTTKERNGST